MKKFIKLIGLGIILITSISVTSVNFPETRTSDYDVAEIFLGIDPDYGTKAITTFGDLSELELILVPTTLEEDTYSVQITRKADDLYLIEGTNYYVETRFCFEFAFSNDAILKIESNYGFTKGTLIFL